MDFKTDNYILFLVLFIGIGIGTVFSLGYTVTQIDNLEEELGQNQQTVTINNSSEESLTELFSEVEESVVAIDAFEDREGQGSGFVYREDGYIVTNYHVVGESETVEVTFTDGLTESAEVLGTDPYTDLAVLKVDRENLNPLQLGNLEDVEVGQKAVAIGNPFGFQSSMTTGIISQTDRLLPVQGGFSIPNILQTDAAINPGNSGGPLMNTQGEVVGVNTAIETDTGVFSGVGFAISAESVERVIPELIEDGSYQHAWLGVSGVDVGPDIAEEMDLEENTGFLVVDVVEGGPTEDSLEQSENVVEINGQEIAVGGDVIIGIGDQEVRGIEDILVYLARYTEAGDEIELTVLREGEEVTVEVELDPRPEINGESTVE